MKPIKILITGGGAPGIVSTIHALKNNFDKRSIKIICTDIKEDVVGKYISDEFYTIPKATEGKDYLDAIKKICVDNDVDVLLPQNTSELMILSKEQEEFEKINTKIIISGYSSIQVSNNKYKLLKICERIGVPTPKYFFVDNFNDLKKSAIKLGYPDNPVLIKPPESNGSRGIRIIDENKDYKKLFYNEKPTNMYTTLNQLYEILGNEFNSLLVMEYLPGDEITIDVYRDNKNFISIPRIREEIRSGISFKNSAIKSEELITYSKIISDHLNLKYCFGYQFKYDNNNIPKIIECNPRVQGTMIFSYFMGVNIIYFAVKHALGEEIPEYNINWNTKLIRYWGAIGITSNEIKKV